MSFHKRHTQGTCNMFNEIDADIARYAADNTVFCIMAAKKARQYSKIRRNCGMFFSRYADDYKKFNTNRFHFFQKNAGRFHLEVKSFKCENPFGVHKLTFETRIKTLYKKSDQKLNGLTYIILCISQAKCRLQIKTFFDITLQRWKCQSTTV